MARQSLTNSRFKCNGCEDYHLAPNHKVHFKCAKHGYLCTEHTVKNLKTRQGYKIPKRYKGTCKVSNGGTYCLNQLVKYVWHDDVSRWIEEGREEEEKVKAMPKAKTKTKPDYLKEINVLVDLLEDDTLTKEVFIKKIREKLK
jgi:hypothetical protein